MEPHTLPRKEANVKYFYRNYAFDKPTSSAYTWAIMDDETLKREQIQRDQKIGNWNRVTASVIPEFQKLKEESLSPLEFHDIPSHTLSIRKPTYPAATVRARMSLNGDSLTIETMRQESNDDFTKKEEKSVLPIDVENGRTFFVHEGRRIEPAEVASLILKPIREVAA